MPETLPPTNGTSVHSIDTEPSLSDAELACQSFLDENVSRLGAFFGMRHISVKIGNEWSTNPESGEVTADPRYFFERGYTADMSAYALLHEMAAHLREIEFDPNLTREVRLFLRHPKTAQLTQATHIFYNIFSDIAGNKLIHAALPDMKNVACELYETKLFPGDDMTSMPRHLQFLYKIIRSEMVPGIETAVLPEVDDTINELRNFRGQGDLIAYSTQVAKSAKKAMPNREKFSLWTNIIYPRWLELYKEDIENPPSPGDEQNQDTQGSDHSEQQSSESDRQTGDQDKAKDTKEQSEQDQVDETGQDNESDESQTDDDQNNAQQESDEQSESEDQQDSGNQSGSSEQQDAGEQPESPDNSKEQGGSGSSLNSEPNFSEHYDDYFENKHPEPLDKASEERLRKSLQQKPPKEPENHDFKDRDSDEVPHPPTYEEVEFERKTGHTLEEQRLYNREVLRWRRQIIELREIFREILNERVAIKRKLRGNHTDGAILNPETLAQTYIEAQSRAVEPPAYADYEKYASERTIAGKTDYVFVFDRSGSMQKNKKYVAAGASLVICLEALAGMQRDIIEAEREENIETDLDIRTSIYTFSDRIHIPKELGSGLTDKERLDSFALTMNPHGGNSDSHVLADILNIPTDQTRKRILIVVSDGEADDVYRCNSRIQTLRANGWHVYGISIGSNAAVKLYAPYSERVDDPTLLPQSLQKFIARTI